MSRNPWHRWISSVSGSGTRKYDYRSSFERGRPAKSHWWGSAPPPLLRRMRAASLARASGISPGMLSRIERGLISPSITSLKALADALHLPVSALFASFDDAPAAIFTRADPTHAIGKRRGEGARCEVLGISGDSGNILKAQMILISSEQETYPELPTIGVLFVHLLTGGLTYSHGRDVFPMLPGDSLLFEAEIPHRIEGGSLALLLLLD
jgi:transcriptional regulator with XRE-family HTH domain